jgi:hypothetical protein
MTTSAMMRWGKLPAGGGSQDPAPFVAEHARDHLSANRVVVDY